MAPNSFFGKLGGKVKNVYNNFFYNGEEDERIPSASTAYQPPMEYSAQAPQYPQSAYSQPQKYQAQQPSYQQPTYQQPSYQQPSYQQPAPQQTAAPAAPAYEQPRYSQPAYPQPAAQEDNPAAPQRNRRMWAHQNEDNVVDFGAYQHNQQGAQPQDAQAAAAESIPAAGRAARIINARGMGDCRSAITLLRNGDSVLIVLENVTDPAEMRRLVDTLSGACYSLTATITKVSRYGVYLLAPQSVAVYADQTTNQMNGAPMRPVQPRGYQQPYAAGPQRPVAQGVYGYQQAQAAYAPQSPFTRRQAPPQEAPQPFYARTAPQTAAVQPFAAQPTGFGYAPDDTAAAE